MTISNKDLISMKSWCVLMCAMFIACLTLFQPSNVLLAQSEPSPSPQTVTTLPTINDKVAEDLQRLTNRVLQLEVDLAKASKAAPDSSGSSLTSMLITGIPSVLAVLLAGIITLFGQRFTAQQSLELARQEAIFSHTEKILEFRIKQMELFYAPMFALLEQSRVLYDKMLYQLVEDEPERYRLISEPDSEDYRMYVRTQDGAWRGFRLLDQFPAVKANQKALVLAERILQIGEQTTKIISDHAGLASSDLIDLLGEYLAHYAVLSAAHKLEEKVPAEPGGHKILYYPRELNEKIKEGYRELNQFIGEYVKASRSMLKALPDADRT